MSLSTLRLFSAFRASAFGASILMAGIAWSAPADSAHASPIHNLGRWFPREVLLGPQAGVQLSRLRASGEYRSLLEPVPAQDRPWISPSLGATLSLRWRSGFSLSLSPRRQAYGLQTGEDTVSFEGNPYPHTLSSRLDLEYNVWPLVAGFDYLRGNHRFGIQAGIYQAFMSDFDLEWRVDGKPSGRRPAVLPRASAAGWLVAAEYGFHWGPGEWTFGLEYQRSIDPALEGLDGSVRAEAAQARLGYAWSVWKRTP